MRQGLRQIRHGSFESVHSYVIRFRQQLNELTYALQHEHKEAIERRVVIDLENKRAVRTFMINLRPEIEARVAAARPVTLQEAQESTFEVEITLGGIDRIRNSRNQNKTQERMERPTARFQERRPTTRQKTTNGSPPIVTNFIVERLKPIGTTTIG